MPLYAIGGFGRAGCLALLALLLWVGSDLSTTAIAVGFFILWTAYGFVSGIVAVPYNDIIGRAIPSSRRSRLLAVRFFGGGVLALAVAWAAHQILNDMPLRAGYAVVVGLAALLLAISALCFVSAGEPAAPPPPATSPGFAQFLREGLVVVREDRRFRLFLYVQWLAAMVSMSLPFYILQVAPDRPIAMFAGTLLAAQTAGALLSNPLWGWWGDGHGKLSLLGLVCRLNAVAPAAALAWLVYGGGADAIPWFAGIFFVIGAVGNGRTIAYLGYLMEISPDDRRPAYSGYFNVLTAPAALSPLAGAALADIVSFEAVFATSFAAAAAQVLVMRRLRRHDGGAP